MGCPNFTVLGVPEPGLGNEDLAEARRTLPATLARLLMQAHGSQQVSPQSAVKVAQAEVCFAGVAQLVEHLFCKQVVRGSSPRASSVSYLSESCPSGQREQAVNLPAYAYAGSNPALSTKAARRSARRPAGVAQLVERQPSKLNVEGSSPFSRSASRAPRGTASVRFAFTRATRRYQSRQRYSTHAHLAQMVEHVLGKDEVTSSILVVGSKPSRSASQSHGSNLGRNSSV